MEEKNPVSWGTIISAMFLVAGTCIGGGMLALPVATGISGFIPFLLMMSICWFAMTITALLLLEVSLWMEEGVHVISMASRILGEPGKILSWLLFLFICYASIVAYTAGAGVQVATAFKVYFNLVISKHIGAILFILLLGPIVYFGSRVVGRVNAVLFIAMVAAYVGLVSMGVTEVNFSLLKQRHWGSSLFAIPLLLTSFSFQTMVPSLTPYLKRHAKSLRWAIIGGTSLAFLIYAIWQWLILGIVPVEGPNGLAMALEKGEPATQFLREHVAGKWICTIAEYFAFFAIATSFLGITLGLFDFLSDGLKISKEGKGGILLGLLIMLPTILFATQFERVFLVALDASGGFGDSILNGLIPVLMVWIGHYHMGLGKKIPFIANKIVLGIVFTFFLFALGLEILVQTGMLSSVYAPSTIPAIYDIIEIEGDRT